MDTTITTQAKSLYKTYKSISVIRDSNDTSMTLEEDKKTVNIQDVQSILNSIKDKKYTPTKKDKLYFYPGCVVPRFKVRESWKPKGVAITIKENNGTHKFLHDEPYDYVNNDWNIYTSTVKDIVEFLNVNKQVFLNYKKDFVLENMEPGLKAVLQGDPTVEIVMNHYLAYYMQGHYGTMSGKDLQGHDYEFPIRKAVCTTKNNRTMSFKDSKVADLMEDIRDNPGAYYVDDAVNKALQEESITIDGDMYDQLKNLLKSSDRDNHTMAMEVMSNCNVEDSAQYVYLLFEEFSTDMSYSKSYGSVNFRALRDSTGLDRNTNYSADNYLEFMSKYNKQNMDLVSAVKTKCLDAANKAIQQIFRNSISQGTLQIELTNIKIVIKGVNDGTVHKTFIEPEIEPEDQTPEMIIEKVVSPCAAHDEASVEELDAEDREMMDMATDYLNDITDGEYSEEEVAEEFKDAIPTKEDLEALKEKLKADNPEVIPGTLDALEEISIVAPVIEAITPEPIDHDNDDDANIFAEGEYVEDPFSDNLTEADDEDLIS